jgi:hypothetical protein
MTVSTRANQDNRVRTGALRSASLSTSTKHDTFLLGRNKRSVCYAHNERRRVEGNGHVNTCSARQSSVYGGATMPFLGYDVAVLTRKKRTRRGQRRVNDLKTSGNTRKKPDRQTVRFSLTTGREGGLSHDFVEFIV